jgi:hypothetical protein
MSKSTTGRFVNAAWSLLLFQFVASAGAVAITAWAAFEIAPRLAPPPTEQAAMAAPAAPSDPAQPTPVNGGAGSVRIIGNVAVGATIAAEFARDPDGLSSAPTYQWLRDGDVIANAVGQTYIPIAEDAGRSLAVRADYVDAAGFNEIVISPAVAVPQVGPTAPMCGRSENLYRVAANVGWCDTGFVVSPHSIIVIRPLDGRWSNAGEPALGGEGFAGTRYAGTVMEDADLASLIGRVGERSFRIGRGTRYGGAEQGTLHLSINDVPGTFGDNQGYLDVSVQGAE